MTTTTPSTEVRLPVPREQLLELGLTEAQIAEAEASPPAVLAFQADEHPGAYFDVGRARRALKAMRQFQHTKGRRWQARPLDPDPWQVVWVIAPIFGWVYFDEESDAVVRVIRTAWVEVPRKNGKSTISSGIALVLLLADGELGAEVYSAAGSREQAGRVFEDARNMCLTSGRARQRVDVLHSVIRARGTGGIFRALSRMADVAHGLNVSGAVIDEVHTLRLRRALVEAIETGTGARDQPLVVFITTADEAEEGTIYDERHTRTRNVAARIVKDASHYGVIWCAEKADDPFLEATWRKANPGLGRSPTLAYMRKEAEKARTSPTYFPTFCRLHLNRRQRDQSRWLDLDRWDDAAAGMVVREQLAGRRAWGGLDLSAVSDLTAWWMGVESRQPGVAMEMIWRFWLPAARVEDLERQLQVPLRTWAKQGWLSLTDGDVIDYAAVQRDVLADCRHVDMQRVSYDRMFAGQLVQALDEKLSGVDVLPVHQTFMGLSPACKELERMLGAGAVRVGGNPVARWHASCVEVLNDGNDNIRPVKPTRAKSVNRIDGIQAAVTGLDGWLRQPKTGLKRVSGSARGH
jgi:phage terminase large subunit-like protein